MAVVKTPNEEGERARSRLTCESERHGLGGRPGFIGCQTCVVPSVLWLGPSNGQDAELVQIQPAESHVCRSQGNCIRSFLKNDDGSRQGLDTSRVSRRKNFSVHYVF